MPKTRPPALQVLFEPWPDPEGERPFERGDGDPEVFAGTYWIDALDEDGNLKDRGFRARRSGCTVCRRHDDDPRAHWDVANDMSGTKRNRRCGIWQDVCAFVKAFGGWKRVHYVELPAWEGLEWQPIPQRRRILCNAADCNRGTVIKLREDVSFDEADCERCNGSGLVAYAGPLPPDRFGMTDEQRRMRRPQAV